MGNCCKKFSDWICPNPWEGMEIQRLYAYDYNIRTVRLTHLEESYIGVDKLQSRQPTTLAPMQPTLTVHTEMLPEKETVERDPLLKKPLLTPASTPVATAATATTPKSSPLQLGIAAVPPPPPLALLKIAKQKKLYIEY